MRTRTQEKTKTKKEITFARRSNKLTPREIAEQKVHAFELSQRRLREFAEENEELFDVLLDLVDAYNADLAEARDSLRNVSTPNGFQMGPFHRAKDSADTVSYNPKFVPHRILNMEGVVKNVDTKVIERLLSDGKITYDDVKDAREEKPGRTPSIRGPKDITISL